MSPYGNRYESRADAVRGSRRACTPHWHTGRKRCDSRSAAVRFQVKETCSSDKESSNDCYRNNVRDRLWSDVRPFEPVIGLTARIDGGQRNHRGVDVPYTTALGQGDRRVGFSLNGTVSGFPMGVVFLSGGGAYDRTTHDVQAGGGFRCLEAVLQPPLSTSINPDDPGPCLKDEGVRWDTAALLDSTMFKCNAAATAELATTSDHTVVLRGDFYRAGDGNEESFTANMIVSDVDISPTHFPGANIWVQGVGCGTAKEVNFAN